MIQQSKIVGAVEIGTSSVKVLIGDIVNGRSLNIIGMGQCSCRGVKKGEVLDFKAASNCTHAAIMGAEKSAGVHVESIYLSQTGSHLEGASNSAEVNVSASDNRVRASDIQRVTNEAKAKELPPGRVYIHHMQNGFLLDGHVVENPLGMEGDKLEVYYWSVHGDENRIRDHIHVVNGFGLNVEDMIISSIASGVMVAEEAEKKAGVLILDIGGGTTDWAYYREGVVVRTGALPVGGDHLLNDISMGLRVSRKHAERMAMEFGKAVLEDGDRDEKVWMVGDQMIGDRYISKRGLIEIINARMKEVFQIVAKQLGELCNTNDVPGGVILTGGVADLPGIEKLAGKTMGLDVRIGRNPSWVREDLRSHEFSTTLGLLHYALTGDEKNEVDEPVHDTGLLRRVARIFAS